jgi:hypothetical protein
MAALSRIRHLVLLGTVGFVLHAYALPVKPDLEKILKEQQQRPRQYEPARAGWDGPEMVRSQEASPNPVLEAYGPTSTIRAIRSSLRAALTPDPAAAAGILMLILLWRIVREQRSRRESAVALVSRSEASKEIRAA